jgi:hypothetical protein
VSAAAKLLADVEEPVGTAERREVVEAKWNVLDVDRRRMLVDELASKSRPRWDLLVCNHSPTSRLTIAMTSRLMSQSRRGSIRITVAGNRKILMSEDFRCLSLSTFPAHPRSTALASIRALISDHRPSRRRPRRAVAGSGACEPGVHRPDDQQHERRR